MIDPNLTNHVIVARMAEMREQELRREAYLLGDSANSFTMPRRAPKYREPIGVSARLLAWAYGLLGR